MLDSPFVARVRPERQDQVEVLVGAGEDDCLVEGYRPGQVLEQPGELEHAIYDGAPPNREAAYELHHVAKP